jgi:hypothetical protein
MTGTRLDGTDRSSVKFVMPKRCACLRTPESPKLNQTRQNRMASARLEFVRTVIDLDVAVREIERRADGFTVEPVTWRDQRGGWPPSLNTDRGAVAGPDSIGIKVRLGDQEGSVVLFEGGWCDVEYWPGSASCEPLTEAPGAPIA